jgi:putative hydrolase of the HAD superfamily
LRSEFTKVLHAVLFDMGGTLDGDGLHWLDRFEASYAAAGKAVGRDELRRAFDEAERRAAIDDGITSCGLEPMVRLHLSWQFDVLKLVDPVLQSRIVSEFVARVRAVTDRNVGLLARLAARGLMLGVVSNGCGNLETLCEEFGYLPHLSVLVDSRLVRLYKPDPAIFSHAVSALGIPPSETLMVGDSFDRDVRPAKSIGMRTAWLHGPCPGRCPDPTLVDIHLAALPELWAALDSPSLAVTC